MTKKERLNQYRLLKLENSLQLQQLERLHGAFKRQQLAAGAALDSRLDEETRLRAVIATNLDEMEQVQRAIEGVQDPMERMVLRMRYIDSDGTSKRTKWEDIAQAIYGGIDEGQMTAVYRLHGQALANLQL